MIEKNFMKLEFDSKSKNESFARVVVASFVSQIDPTIEQITEVKTAISEAVTNSIIHGYEEKKGLIIIKCYIEENKLKIIVKDEGKGIENINKAREPLFTSKPELERSGMGFTVMESFMDKVIVESKKDKGTKIIMLKEFEVNNGEKNK